MKHLRIYSLVLIAFVAAVTACKDDSIQLVPEWETGVQGLGAFAPGSPQNFVFQDPTKALDINLKWVSIDSKNEVSKIDVFVLFDEPYEDPDGNPVVANHGTATGKLLASFSDASVPGNRENIKLTISQTSMYEMFKDNTFDYDHDEATAPTLVFDNPAVPDRTPASRFVKGDAFTIRWEFTTADGRKFYKWGVSVCTEFPGANCLVSWGVICASDLGGHYDVESTFVSPDYGFSSAAPDYQYCPTGNDGSIHDGVQTYDNIEVTALPAAASYEIPDITNGFEPKMWCNPPVKAVVSDQCGTLVLVSTTFTAYGYSILAGSKVNGDGSLTIVWTNEFGENGVSTFTPVP